MSSHVATRNSETNVRYDRIATLLVSIVLLGVVLGAVYVSGFASALSLGTTVENGVFVSIGFVFSLWLLDVAKVNLNQGDLTKMDALLVSAIVAIGTMTYVVVTSGTPITGAWLSIGAAVIFRLALIVVARDIICAIRPD